MRTIPLSSDIDRIHKLIQEKYTPLHVEVKETTHGWVPSVLLRKGAKYTGILQRVSLDEINDQLKEGEARLKAKHAYRAAKRFYARYWEEKYVSDFAEPKVRVIRKREAFA